MTPLRSVLSQESCVPSRGSRSHHFTDFSRHLRIFLSGDAWNLKAQRLLACGWQLPDSLEALFVTQSVIWRYQLESLFHVGSGVSAPPCDQDFTLQPERCLLLPFILHARNPQDCRLQCCSCTNGAQKRTPLHRGSTAPGMDLGGTWLELWYAPTRAQRANNCS